MQLKKAFLTFCFFAVAGFGLLYGISPRWYAATFLGITDLNVDFAHILRATAGLYVALAAFWLYAASHEKYRDAGIAAAILFAGGLAAGRCLSLMLDGRPAPILLSYLGAELAVIVIGYWVYRLPQSATALPLESWLRRNVGTILVLGVLLGVLGLTVYYAITAWNMTDTPMDVHGWIALTLGVFFSCLIGFGLMFLIFFSSRHGYDDPPAYAQENVYQESSVTDAPDTTTKHLEHRNE